MSLPLLDENDYYTLSVGKNEDSLEYKGEQYLIRSKVTGVIEAESRIHAQALSYLTQINDAYFTANLKKAPSEEEPFSSFVDDMMGKVTQAH